MPNRNQVGATLIPMIADVALSKGNAVVLSSTEDHVTLPAGTNSALIFGFAANDALQGESVAIHVSGGIAHAIAHAAISMGDFLQNNGTDGSVQTAAPAAGSNAFICAKALRAATAAGDVIPVLPLNCILQG